MAVCVARLRAAGLERVVVFDLTPRGFHGAVVRVVVPGLEGYGGFSFYAPGRRARATAAAKGAVS